MEKVSVIIPVYNDEKYLEQCVKSALDQTYQNLEVILVDDGSTDTTPTLCEKLHDQDQRVRVLHKENGGVGSSRNAGLAMATGDYVLFIDNDDLIDKDQIEILHDLLKKTDADIAIGNYRLLLDDYEWRSYIDVENHYYEKTYTPAEWFKFQYDGDNRGPVFTVPWCKLYKRSLFKNIVYPTNTKIEDDLTTWKVYLLADKIAYVNKSLYTHRRHKTNVSSTVDEAAVYPLTAVENRLALLQMIGFDISDEARAFKERLAEMQGQGLREGHEAAMGRHGRLPARNDCPARLLPVLGCAGNGLLVNRLRAVANADGPGSTDFGTR
ncbi:hypothetical protein IV45_GL001374 [Limosilactobacillus secaliphilus]|uniref:Glycosyltransferase 2-like domain-containing protein n=1 Tax=Limosilactobacillus secaliphilus TaxID=396268 RepID=A0A0R2I2Y1_9LACO|nr:glycosyltransferase family 2 protein [Limosilactobacillus secaliphilus]KRN59625.1 hypothetical protein IV45_GL001374 [Limosilactobacillus secaliphilus]